MRLQACRPRSARDRPSDLAVSPLDVLQLANQVLDGVLRWLLRRSWPCGNCARRAVRLQGRTAGERVRDSQPRFPRAAAGTKAPTSHLEHPVYAGAHDALPKSLLLPPRARAPCCRRTLLPARAQGRLPAPGFGQRPPRRPDSAAARRRPGVRHILPCIRALQHLDAPNIRGMQRCLRGPCGRDSIGNERTQILCPCC